MRRNIFQSTIPCRAHQSWLLSHLHSKRFGALRLSPPSNCGEGCFEPSTGPWGSSCGCCMSSLHTEASHSIQTRDSAAKKLDLWAAQVFVCTPPDLLLWDMPKALTMQQDHPRAEHMNYFQAFLKPSLLGTTTLSHILRYYLAKNCSGTRITPGNEHSCWSTAQSIYTCQPKSKLEIAVADHRAR